MPYKASVFKVMIASPGDVLSERTIVREVLAEWNAVNADSRRIVLLPVGWETHSSPTMGERPQTIINKQILKDCDLLVGVFWTRIGTPTTDYASGTVEEIEEHVKAGKPAMLYFSSAPVIMDSVDPDQYSELKKFKEACQSKGLLQTYNDFNDFKERLYHHLQLKLNQDNYFTKGEAIDESQPISSSIPDIPALSREAQVLLKNASQDGAGHIMRLPHLGGFNVQTNGKEMVTDNGPQTRAVWEDAIQELENKGLIKDQGYKRQVFAVTRVGYVIAELIQP